MALHMNRTGKHAPNSVKFVQCAANMTIDAPNLKLKENQELTSMCEILAVGKGKLFIIQSKKHIRVSYLLVESAANLHTHKAHIIKSNSSTLSSCFILCFIRFVGIDSGGGRSWMSSLKTFVVFWTHSDLHDLVVP